jgi:hypothetical protein
MTDFRLTTFRVVVVSPKDIESDMGLDDIFYGREEGEHLVVVEHDTSTTIPEKEATNWAKAQGFLPEGTDIHDLWAETDE